MWIVATEESVVATQLLIGGSYMPRHVGGKRFNAVPHSRSPVQLWLSWDWSGVRVPHRAV